MWEFLGGFVSSSSFIPHGHCYLWQPNLVWLHVVSDAAIALAYYSIPIWLLYFIHKRRDIPFPWIFLLFGTFIVACGTTHILEVWTLWHPIYWVSGTVKALTATVSLFTALELGPLMPKLLALPSSAQLEATNRELEQQILERQQAEAVLAKQAEMLQKQAQLLDLAHDTILVRTLDGVITFWNHGAEEMYGWSKAEALSCHSHTLLQTKFPQPLAEIEALLLQSDRWEGELIHTKQDGSQLIAASRWALQRDENGDPVAVLEINNDISEAKRDEVVRKQAELALQTAHTQLEARVAERTTALAQVNKELRLEIVERQRMEATLRESEQRFRATFEQAAVGIAHVGLEGRWLRVNQKLCDIVGYDRSELLNSTFQDITYPADLATDLGRVEQVLAGLIPTFSMEKRYIRKDGSLIWVNLTVSLVREADKPKYFISVIEDISERRQAEAKLQKSLKKLSDMQFALDQAAIVAATDQRGVITYVNDKFCELSQYTQAELLGKNHRLINSGYHDPTFFHELWATISQGKVWKGEIKNRAKDGSYYWVDTTIVPFLDEQGQPFQYLAIRFDITNRKQIEDDLRESQMRFRTLAEATAEGILIQDQGLIVDANQAFAKIFGYELEAVVGLSVATFLTPESSALADSHIQMNDEAAFELTGVRRDGTVLPLEVRCRKSTYQGRNVRISAIRDITALKRSEEHIRASLQEKEVLLKEIHHRVKNNLQIISSLLNLQSQNLEDQAVLSIFRESQNRIESMALIHEKLYQSEDMARINASEYIYDLVSNLFYTYEVNTDAIALKLNADEIWLGLDTAIPCGLIINELVLNALKHGFPEGRTGEVCIHFGIKNSRSLMLSVSDNGIGLPKDLDYRNTDSLGLQLVNALTHQIEGIITINNDKGIQFEIVFPNQNWPRTMATVNIMVVEDESIVAKDLQNRLKKFGYAVPVVASSGEEAIARASENDLDLVLMDIRLKGAIDGIEAARQIHHRFQLPIIYLTAYADDNTLARAKQTQPFGYILKPFKERELNTTIEITLARHRLEQQLQAREQWLGTVLRSIADAVITTDIQGLITFMNPVAESLTGWQQSQALGKPAIEVFQTGHVATQVFWQQPTHLELQAFAAVSVSEEAMLRTLENQYIPIEQTITPLKDDQGSIIGAVLVFREITERLQAREAIRKQSEQAQLLAELQKLNQLKDDFLSTVSHELRTPMSNMKMALQMLTIATTVERQQRYLEILKAECAREIDLINDLLDLQRLEAAAYPTFLVESINLQSWFSNLVVPFRSRIQEHHQVLKIDLPENLPPLITDRSSLERLIAELLNNACKYTPAGGQIILSAGPGGNPSTNNPLVPSFPFTRLTIQNQAEISPTELPRIFDKFYRVPHADPWKQGGTGLGLALVKRLVEQLQGDIQVESAHGWTSFTIQLPPLSLGSNPQANDK